MIRRPPGRRVLALLVAGVLMPTLVGTPALFAQPAASGSNICLWDFLDPLNLEGSGADGRLTPTEGTRTVVYNLEHVCTALVAEDLPTACADGEQLLAQSGALVCAADGTGGGTSLTVEEVDGAPTGTASVLRLDQADGLALTDETGGTWRLDLSAVPLSVLAEDVLTEAELDSEAELEAQIGVGVVTPAEDDDVPEAGDFGAATHLDANGALLPDVVGLAELDDAAATPTDGDLLQVTGTGARVAYLTPHAGTDVTADLEEEAHATEHQDGGADELSIAGLSGLAADPQTPATHAASHQDGGADELSPLQQTVDTCADGEILKADTASTGKWICGSAGSAAFTDLDTDYGPETYAGPLDMLAGQLHPPGGTAAPAATDCDAAGEAGRVYVDRATAGEPIIHVCEGASGWTQISGAGGDPWAGQYHPDRQPTTGLVAASSDEFAGGFEATWTAANQDDATLTARADVAVMDESTQSGGGNNLRVWWLDAPASGDYIVAIKLSAFHVAEGNFGRFGIELLDGGTRASPSNLVEVHVRAESTERLRYSVNNRSGYTTTEGTGTSFTDPTSALSQAWRPLYLVARFTDATDLVEGWVSADGISMVSIGSVTTANGNPGSIGIAGNFPGSPDITGTFYWFRTCTSTACVTDLEVGE